jgi:hypothetical protein
MVATTSSTSAMVTSRLMAHPELRVDLVVGDDGLGQVEPHLGDGVTVASEQAERAGIGWLSGPAGVDCCARGVQVDDQG